MAKAALDPIAGDHLIRLYASRGSLKEANDVFFKVSNPSTYTWNAIISAHAKNAHGKRALELYHGMRQQGFIPDKATYLGALKACTSINDIRHGGLIHKHIIKSGFETDVIVGSTLVDMYAKCGQLETAHSVFDKLEHRNVVSWGAMVAGYAQCGQGLTAFQLFDRMHEEGIKPDRVMFLCILKACCSLEAIGQGRLIHNQIVQSELDSEVSIGSSLVDLYAKCGSLEEAQSVFKRLPNRNVVTWSTLIAGYAHHEHNKMALELFEKMQQEGIKPGRVAFLSILKACSSMGAIGQGRLIHDHVIKGTLDTDFSLGSTLVDMYGKCGSISEAKSVFDSLLYQTVVSYGAMMAGYAQHGHGHLALKLFEQMQKEGIKPDRVVFIAILKACGSIQALDQGKLIHYELVGSRIELDITVRTALIDMYVKCGCVGEAWELFKKSPTRDGVLWSTMLTGFLEHGRSHLIFQLFKEMQQEGIKPDSALFICVVKACASMGALNEGRLIHKQIVHCGLQSDMALRSSLVDMYAKCESVEDARKVFDESLDRNVVSWGAMIAGHAQHAQGFLALELFSKMQQEGVKPENVTFVCALKACCSIGALEQGRLIHTQIIERDSQSDVIIGNTLVDFYAKCDRLEEAQKVFDSLFNQDVVSWSALVAGYAMVGNYKLARQCLDVMQQQGLKPDNVLFTSVLSAFSHTGLIKEGHDCLEAMAKDYGIRPSVEHYNCIIDLLGRSGCLKEAQVFLQAMPVPNAISWMSLLTSCRTYGDKELAMQCFDEMVQLDPDEASSYVIMSGLYADAHQWDEVDKIQEMKKCAAAWKEPGRAWIEIKHKVYEFLVGGEKHPLSLEMHAKLNRIGRIVMGEGSVPQVSLIMMLETQKGNELVSCKN